MKKILIARDNQSDTTSWLRAWGAFTHPSMKSIVTPIRPPDDQRWAYDWSYYAEVDVVYLHRPVSAHHFHIIERTKQMGIPLWVDHDDDLEHVTPDNPYYSVCASKEAQECIRHSYREADILSVGGARQQKRLQSEYDREVSLLPNALDDRLLSFKRPFQMSKKIVWRGSLSHEADLLFFDHAFEQIMRKHTELAWTFFGFNPYWMNFPSRIAKHLEYVKPLNLFDFYNAWCSHNPAFHVIPLIDTEFNRVKSNLAWSDGILAGASVFGPDFEEYDRPGIYKYDQEHFLERLDKFLQLSEDHHRENHHDSWDWIRDNILQSKINQKRIEILRNL